MFAPVQIKTFFNFVFAVTAARVSHFKEDRHPFYHGSLRVNSNPNNDVPARLLQIKLFFLHK